MRRFANGSVLYDDSPWIIEIVLFLFAVVLGATAWTMLRHNSTNHVAIGMLIFFILICIVGMLAQHHRRYFFSPSNATMLWSKSGLFGRSNGEVAFKDVTVGIDTSSSDAGSTYRVMLTSPAGPMPLTQAYIGDLRAIERQATELRALLGQSVLGRVEDQTR